MWKKGEQSTEWRKREGAESAEEQSEQRVRAVPFVLSVLLFSGTLFSLYRYVTLNSLCSPAISVLCILSPVLSFPFVLFPYALCTFDTLVLHVYPSSVLLHSLLSSFSGTPPPPPPPALSLFSCTLCSSPLCSPTLSVLLQFLFCWRAESAKEQRVRENRECRRMESVG